MSSIETKAVRTYPDSAKRVRPLSIPIHQAVNFESDSSQSLGQDFKTGSEFVYQRFGHPTSKAAGEKIALLEQAEAGLVFSSGMGAICTTLMALLDRSPLHVVAQRQIFGQTYRFLDETLRLHGVDTTFIDVRDERQLVNAFQPNTRLVYIESPSNPLLQVTDIRKAATIAHERGALLVIDSTFASPFLQNPLTLGADVVVHSATKFLAGHSDVMCGAVAGSRPLVQQIERMQVFLGTVLDPHACWLLLRGIKTLGVRVARQSENALAIAQFLSQHEAVESVEYPWLSTSKSYATSARQMRGGGGVVSFVLKGGIEAARQFVDALQLVSIATSLGGVESVIEVPADLDFSEDELGAAAAKTGIPTGLIRFSVGIEDLADLLADVEVGLKAVRVPAGR